MTATILLHCAKIEKLPSGLLRISYKDEYEIELSDVKEVEKAFIQLSNNESIYCVMLSMGRFHKFSKEAQEFLATKASIVPRIKASAVVLDNLPIRLITKFFIRFHKPQFPTKIFSNEKAAIGWLQMVKEMNAMKSVG